MEKQLLKSERLALRCGVRLQKSMKFHTISYVSEVLDPG